MKKSIFDKSIAGFNSHHIFDPDFATGNEKELFAEEILNKKPLGLPELPESEVVRHFTDLSNEVHGVDDGIYPLGSCTMKYNPKRNDKFATLTGFRDVHPLQPFETMQGVWQMMYELQNFITEITGMDFVTLQPAAGANGEITGLLMIHKYFRHQNQHQRDTILVADSAHGTNLASSSMAGFKCKIIPTDSNGLMDVKALENALDENTAALMLTNPSTLGLFEEHIVKISQMIHKNGSLLYYDGANLNALMGIVRPGDMGFDVVHINTHKTLSTPHGGGGPGAGPVGVKKFLHKYLPTPIAVKEDGVFKPEYNLEKSIGHIKSFFGHVDILLRAYCYILTLGGEGLKQATENAVLNANYVQAKLQDVFPSIYKQFCMHECLLNAENHKVNAYSMAKRLIDYNIHPPTLVGAGCVYFAEGMESAMLVEPTETETKENLDYLINTLKKIAKEAEETPQLVENSPYSTRIAKIPEGSNKFKMEG